VLRVSKPFQSSSHIWTSETMHCGKEERQSETLYAKLRRDWVDMFTTWVDITKDATCTPGYMQSVSASPP